MASSAYTASTMNGSWMIPRSHWLPRPFMGSTLLSGGYSEHRLPAAICEGGCNHLHPLALPLYCHCNEYFQSITWKVSNSGNTKEVVIGTVVSQFWQRVNVHQYMYWYICLYVLHLHGLPVTTDHSHYLPSKSYLALLCCVEICLVPNNFQFLFCKNGEKIIHFWVFFIPYPTGFPYGNGMVLHFYQQQGSSTTKTVHKVINKGLKAYV